MTHLVTPRRKKIASLLVRGKPKSLALELIKHRRYLQPLLGQVGALLKREMRHLCSNNVADSITSIKLANFSWSNYFRKIKSHAPCIVELLTLILTGKSKTNKDIIRVTGLIVSIITSFKRSSMNVVQKMISIILYAGHCSKQVNKVTKNLFHFLYCIGV